MIEDAPRIKVSGIDYPIYAADFTVGGAQGPSTATISFVNKNGEYSPPSLNTNNKVKIELGDSFSFVGFPVGYTSSNSAGGKTLSVLYWDTSVILDKIFIGLKGVHGQADKSNTNLSNVTVYGNFNNVILLGSYVDPCKDIDVDYVDPCNPCLSVTDFQTVENNNTQKNIDCRIERMTQILDVIYPFNELISALKSANINFYNTPLVNNNYYGRYTGTAREVLNAWCQDLGLTFVWQNESVYFVDLKSGIEINDTSFYETCSLIETSESKSIENVSSKGVILYFGADGSVQKYDCSNKENTFRLSMIPITLKDIFWSSSPYGNHLQSYIRKYYTAPKTGDDSIVPLQIATLLTKYSSVIRDLILLYEYYEVDEVNQSLVEKDFPLLGMKIKHVWGVNSAPVDETQSLLRSVFYENIPEQTRYMAEKMGAGMAVIEYDQAKYEKFIEFESKLADFMGRYWITFFSKGDRYSYNSPGGSVEYYDAGTPNVLPFADLFPISSQSVSTFFQYIINDSAQKNKDSSHVGAVETTNPNTFAKSLLLMDRQPSWEPTPQSDEIVKLAENLSLIHPYTFAPFKIEGFGDGRKINEYYCLIFNKPNTLDLEDLGEGDHPIESSNENLIVNVDNAISNYGLRSSRCKAYRISSKNQTDDKNLPNWNHSINLFMPPQSHDTFGSSYPGVTIIASPNAEQTNDSNVLIEKREVIFGDVPVQDKESVSIAIDYKDISSILYDILQEGGSRCEYDVERIKELISQYNLNTTRKKSIVSEVRNYTIGGLPTRELTFLDGVTNYSLRYGGDGLTSSISFSNTPPLPKSESLQNKEFEKNMIKRYVKKKIALSTDKIVL